ncbi:tRNA (adenosine(37)-N6)-dimethylallyltransferase MiaA [Neorhizobium sp. SOG26]|uniref:tRNA (adenosine(37)-N6)-dimethylallyltransferase MiaA n=1 Tax=Neorhizobium sp. SOG26 TaxID=2060726 RepID=UPI000E56B2DB|nr:tRNA (adenosine(37)-N6)-dimethylallyltransferase MiaA [Neorhizobium sp. SOG26]AXV15546.1 tRNA (adenosine(37)-N6)-dimethylallyltransferase MiaA [Neorhizobium sp. SOG26]
MKFDLLEDTDAVLITGPTASGKSALAVEVAKHVGGVVINADSMQVYDTLKVLTARPSEEDMQGVPHFLYGHVPATRTYSTGEWLREVTPLLETLKGEGRMPVIVGGTGLYFKALTGGLSDMPEISQDTRCAVRLRLREQGAPALHAALSERDPEAARSLQPTDGQRIVRALEVLEETGTSLLAFQERRGPLIVDPARATKLVVLPDRAVLHERINQRFQRMMESGALDEVRALLAKEPAADAPVMKAIGVREIAEMLEGRMTPDEVVERCSALTRQYAKRQMTWFRNQMDQTWRRVN